MSEKDKQDYKSWLQFYKELSSTKNDYEIAEFLFASNIGLVELIDKAIEELDVYINYCSIDGENYNICKKPLNCMIKARDILKGEDNESSRL